MAPQGWPPPYQQQNDQRYDSCLNYLFKCSCCFHGTTNTFMKYLCMLLGSLILLHGIIGIIIAGIAFSEAKNFLVNGTAVDEMKSGGKKNVTSIPATVHIYAYYFSLIPGFATIILAIAASGRNVGGFLFAFFITLIFEIFPGACIIGGAVLLKQILCALSYVPLVLWFTENIVEVVALPFAVTGPTAGPSYCNTPECATTAILGVFVKLFFLCMIYTCMAAGLTLWEQIRNGVYGDRLAVQPLAPARIYKVRLSVNASTVVDQTAFTADARKSIQEPGEEYRD